MADSRLSRSRAEGGRVERARLTFRRLAGLDRSGPPPPETLKGAPLRPWTVPNAIGFIRLALIPLFVAIGIADDDGVTRTGAILFAVVAWSDYADGIAARLTGQYSRLGALMDPATDRLLMLGGATVCWVHELLPRWALVVLALREAGMLLIVRYGLRHGIDLKINWPGRLAVWPLGTAVFAALVGLEILAEASLYLGLFLALWATALYLREGRRQLSS